MSNTENLRANRQEAKKQPKLLEFSKGLVNNFTKKLTDTLSGLPKSPKEAMAMAGLRLEKMGSSAMENIGKHKKTIAKVLMAPLVMLNLAGQMDMGKVQAYQVADANIPQPQVGQVQLKNAPGVEKALGTQGTTFDQQRARAEKVNRKGVELDDGTIIDPVGGEYGKYANADQTVKDELLAAQEQALNDVANKATTRVQELMKKGMSRQEATLRQGLEDAIKGNHSEAIKEIKQAIAELEAAKKPKTILPPSVIPTIGPTIQSSPSPIPTVKPTATLNPQAGKQQKNNSVKVPNSSPFTTTVIEVKPEATATPTPEVKPSNGNSIKIPKGAKNLFNTSSLPSNDLQASKAQSSYTVISDVPTTPIYNANGETVVAIANAPALRDIEQPSEADLKLGGDLYSHLTTVMESDLGLDQKVSKFNKLVIFKMLKEQGSAIGIVDQVVIPPNPNEEINNLLTRNDTLIRGYFNRARDYNRYVAQYGENSPQAQKSLEELNEFAKTNILQLVDDYRVVQEQLIQETRAKRQEKVEAPLPGVNWSLVGQAAGVVALGATAVKNRKKSQENEGDGEEGEAEITFDEIYKQFPDLHQNLSILKTKNQESGDNQIIKSFGIFVGKHGNRLDNIINVINKVVDSDLDSGYVIQQHLNKSINRYELRMIDDFVRVFLGTLEDNDPTTDLETNTENQELGDQFDLGVLINDESGTQTTSQQNNIDTLDEVKELESITTPEQPEYQVNGETVRFLNDFIGYIKNGLKFQKEFKALKDKFNAIPEYSENAERMAIAKIAFGLLVKNKGDAHTEYLRSRLREEINPKISSISLNDFSELGFDNNNYSQAYLNAFSIDFDKVVNDIIKEGEENELNELAEKIEDKGLTFIIKDEFIYFKSFVSAAYPKSKATEISPFEQLLSCMDSDSGEFDLKKFVANIQGDKSKTVERMVVISDKFLKLKEVRQEINRTYPGLLINLSKLHEKNQSSGEDKILKSFLVDLINNKDTRGIIYAAIQESKFDIIYFIVDVFGLGDDGANVIPLSDWLEQLNLVAAEFLQKLDTEEATQTAQQQFITLNQSVDGQPDPSSTKIEEPDHTNTTTDVVDFNPFDDASQPNISNEELEKFAETLRQLTEGDQTPNSGEIPYIDQNWLDSLSDQDDNSVSLEGLERDDELNLGEDISEFGRVENEIEEDYNFWDKANDDDLFIEPVAEQESQPQPPQPENIKNLESFLLFENIEGLESYKDIKDKFSRENISLNFDAEITPINLDVNIERLYLSVMKLILEKDNYKQAILDYICDEKTGLVISTISTLAQNNNRDLANLFYKIDYLLSQI